jgi:hypothetical protein
VMWKSEGSQGCWWKQVERLYCKRRCKLSYLCHQISTIDLLYQCLGE